MIRAVYNDKAIEASLEEGLGSAALVLLEKHKNSRCQSAIRYTRREETGREMVEEQPHRPSR